MVFNIRENLSRIELLPNEMRERAEYLLRNPRLGRKVIGKTPYKKIKSNCFGTVLWVLGDWAVRDACKVSEEIPQVYEGHVNSFVVPNRPSYFEINVMETFLDKHYIENKDFAPGDLMVLEDSDFYKKHGWSVVHAGIWTGKDNYVLHQDGLGENFGLEEFYYDDFIFKRMYSVKRKNQTS